MRVVVVGAEIGRLATAAALRRVGLSVHVLEQAREFSRVGAGIALAEERMRALPERVQLEQRDPSRRLRAAGARVESPGVRMYRKADIRPLRPDDEPLLFGLASIDRGADERTLAVLERETVFVAEIEGTPAGYVALEREEQASVRVDQLFVSPEHEAEGVGRQLLDYAEGYAIYAGAAKLRVIVSAEDERAVRFYRGRGFVPAEPNVLELVLPQQ
ncbi:MAG: GNAT family N-acetyltransferase [Actinomycetota bacterium]|nr:GNAT family N-acetyltransferase [Actinomycetota bacterium]